MLSIDVNFRSFDVSIQPSAVSRQPWPLATLREWLKVVRCSVRVAHKHLK
ncbi:MAG: hypothetical protein F6J98_42450 [Moorea sp. SIO4G2]|nr:MULTISPECIES: hypothetical protein [Moorena]NEO48756.1 hypothetical protein [Moorena sp. SIO4A3]NEO66681.1 hypothetical protein [Moorena sp. SIO4G2]NEO11160.1 hypothetical protein [Moorena sp. SIO3E8]NEP29453.1 hypothetical protein [Moorena sp. SIO3I6]NEP98069.1 hypothetical protein [Moorena sp. SIO3F7]